MNAFRSAGSLIFASVSTSRRKWCATTWRKRVGVLVIKSSHRRVERDLVDDVLGEGVHSRRAFAIDAGEIGEDQAQDGLVTDGEDGFRVRLHLLYARLEARD